MKKREKVMEGGKVKEHAIKARMEERRFREFKAMCVMEGKNIGQVTAELIEGYLKKEVGKVRRDKGTKEGS